MKESRVRDIKHSQREAFLLREISALIMRVVHDDARLAGLYVNRVQLSPDRGLCTILLQTSGGPDRFKEQLPFLILYKPSIRTALSKALHSRYTPNLIFKYDSAFDKQREVNELIDALIEKGKL